MADTREIIELIQQLRGRHGSGEKPGFQLREKAMNLLVQRGKEAVPYLVQLLKDESAAVREHAVRALGYIGDEAALPALLNAVKPVYTRGAAISALQGMGPAAVPALLKLATVEEDSIRNPALYTLCMMGDTALPVLRNILMDGEANPGVREAAGNALSLIRKDRLCPFGGSRTMGVDCKYCERTHKEGQTQALPLRRQRKRENT